MHVHLGLSREQTRTRTVQWAYTRVNLSTSVTHLDPLELLDAVSRHGMHYLLSV
jgi:hypothetical protein